MRKVNIFLIIGIILGAAVFSVLVYNLVSDYKYKKDHQNTCEEACYNRKYLEGSCMSEGSAKGADQFCENTGGTDIGGGYKECDRPLIGSWTVCCCK